MLKLLRWGNVLLVLITLLCYLSPYVSPAFFWPLAFFGPLYPWLLLFNLLFIILWLAMRRKQFLLSLACILVGWTHLTSFVGLRLPRAYDGGNALRVMSFNTYGFRMPDGNGYRYEAEQLSELFPVDNLDIVCFQEYPAINKRHPFTAYFQAQTELEHAYSTPGGALTIVSRFPVTNGYTHYFQKQHNGYQYADIEVEQQTFRVFNLHLLSTGVSGIADEVATEGNFKERKTWLNIRGMAAQFKRSATKRATQAERVAKEIADSPYPVILCGDFNAVPQSYTYRQLAAGLQDAFRAAGTGLGTTYGGLIPALRIDYVLADPRFEVIDYNVKKEAVSDHYSVEAILRWEKH